MAPVKWPVNSLLIRTMTEASAKYPDISVLRKMTHSTIGHFGLQAGLMYNFNTNQGFGIGEVNLPTPTPGLSNFPTPTPTPGLSKSSDSGSDSTQKCSDSRLSKYFPIYFTIRLCIFIHYWNSLKIKYFFSSFKPFFNIFD